MTNLRRLVMTCVVFGVSVDQLRLRNWVILSSDRLVVIPIHCHAANAHVPFPSVRLFLVLQIVLLELALPRLGRGYTAADIFCFCRKTA